MIFLFYFSTKVLGLFFLIALVMNKQRIGENANRVWNLLGTTNGKWSYADLKSETGLCDRDLNAALGWLAHDGKVEFEQCGSHEFFYVFMNTYIG